MIRSTALVINLFYHVPTRRGGKKAERFRNDTVSLAGANGRKRRNRIDLKSVTYSGAKLVGSRGVNQS